jgi:hypothetical protein
MTKRHSSGTRPAVREHHRLAAELAVRYEVQDGEWLEAVARDLSLGGAFIDTAQIPAFGTSVRLALELPNGKGTIEVAGVVRWSNASGFGMQFGLLGAKETHVLVGLLADLRDVGAEVVGRTSSI